MPAAAATVVATTARRAQSGLQSAQAAAQAVISRAHATRTSLSAGVERCAKASAARNSTSVTGRSCPITPALACTAMCSAAGNE